MLHLEGRRPSKRLSRPVAAGRLETLKLAGIGFSLHSRSVVRLQCLSHGWRRVRPTWKRLAYPPRMLRQGRLA